MNRCLGKFTVESNTRSLKCNERTFAIPFLSAFCSYRSTAQAMGYCAKRTATCGIMREFFAYFVVFVSVSFVRTAMKSILTYREGVLFPANLFTVDNKSTSIIIRVSNSIVADTEIVVSLMFTSSTTSSYVTTLESTSNETDPTRI